MPDISMCLNESCPKKGDCYRFSAQPNPRRQSYAMFAPDDKGECEHFAIYILATPKEGAKS